MFKKRRREEVVKKRDSEVLRDGELLRTNTCRPRQGDESLKNLIQELKTWLLSREQQDDNTKSI